MAKLNNYTDASFEKAQARINGAVSCAANGQERVLHVGTANGKTSAVNEGTSPLVTCSEYACRTCGRKCYAVWHIDNRLTAARRNHAENTIYRRMDPVTYYREFFQAAEKAGTFLRINETGDFENVEQARAFASVARQFPSVRVIGYTRRPELAETVATFPPSVSVRYSQFTDADIPSAVLAAGIKTCRVSETENTSTCPSQIAKAKGLKWTCADCVAHNCGCFGPKSEIVFEGH